MFHNIALSFARSSLCTISKLHQHHIRGFSASCEKSPISLSEYAQRRRALVTELGRLVSQSSDTRSKHLFIFPSSELQYMAHHVPYPFHQDSQFFYLTGFPEANAVLTLDVTVEPMPPKFTPHVNYEEYLFVEVRSKQSELWNGPSLGVRGSSNCTAIPKTYDIMEFGRFLNSQDRHTILWYSPIVQRSGESHAPNNFILNEVLKFKQKMEGTLKFRNPDPLVDKLRLVKSPAELYCLRNAASITCECMLSSMANSYPGITEASMHGHLEYEARSRGSCLGYPPVIAGGERSHIIHYLKNDQPIYNGELVLLDTGCRFGGYTADVTRTWPVNGRYTSAQRILHDILEETLTTCVNSANPERSIQDLHCIMLSELARHLVTEGIIGATDSSSLVQQICPHSVGHFLGLDVHDTPTVTTAHLLQPGMVFPLEPGIYMRQELKHYNIPDDFIGIGLRLEDDFVMSSDGTAVCLTSALPRNANQIESLVGKSLANSVKSQRG